MVDTRGSTGRAPLGEGGINLDGVPPAVDVPPSVEDPPLEKGSGGDSEQDEELDAGGSGSDATKTSSVDGSVPVTSPPSL